MRLEDSTPAATASGTEQLVEWYLTFVVVRSLQ